MSDHAWNVISLLRSGEWCPAPCGIREGCGCADAIQDAINAAIASEREANISIVFGLCMSDNNSQEIAAAIRARGQPRSTA